MQKQKERQEQVKLQQAVEREKPEKLKEAVEREELTKLEQLRALKQQGKRTIKKS